MALKPRGIIEIPNGRDTSFDHGAFDPKTRRVFIAHTARDCVDVIDHDTSRHIATLLGFPEAAGVVAHDGNVLITNRGAASVAWLDAATMQTRFASPTVPRPSAVRPLKHRRRQVTGVDAPFVVDWWRECRGARRGRDASANRRG